LENNQSNPQKNTQLNRKNMHHTALQNCQQFFESYGESINKLAPKARVVEIGSQDVNGSLRTFCPANFDYIGVDFVAGKGVDLILDDPYTLPFESESVDVVLSSSCFEHSEMFWLLYIEIMRILKPTGVFYLNVPSNGELHRWPVDCWRFYPDSGRALITWAKRNGMNSQLLESYTSTQIGDQWNDFVAVFLKNEAHTEKYPNRILHIKTDYSNGLIFGENDFSKMSIMPEDKKKMAVINQIIDNKIKIL
jgi:SAM-dependent methyltransferase